MPRTTKPRSTLPVGPRSGFIKATFSIEPGQMEAVRLAAKKRADASGRFRPDASEIVREALALWMKQARP